MTTLTDEIEIVNSLLNEEYIINEMELEFLINCRMLCTIQIYIFEQMFNGEDLIGHVGYYDDSEFKGNENDLLMVANLCKNLTPIINKLSDEIERRQIDTDTHNDILKKCLISYANKRNVDLTNTELQN